MNLVIYRYMELLSNGCHSDVSPSLFGEQMMEGPTRSAEERGCISSVVGDWRLCPCLIF